MLIFKGIHWIRGCAALRSWRALVMNSPKLEMRSMCWQAIRGGEVLDSLFCKHSQIVAIIVVCAVLDVVGAEFDVVLADYRASAASPGHEPQSQSPARDRLSSHPRQALFACALLLASC